MRNSAIDAATGHRATHKCVRALKQFGFAWNDLVEKVDLAKELNKNGRFMLRPLVCLSQKGAGRQLARRGFLWSRKVYRMS